MLATVVVDDIVVFIIVCPGASLSFLPYLEKFPSYGFMFPQMRSQKHIFLHPLGCRKVTQFRELDAPCNPEAGHLEKAPRRFLLVRGPWDTHPCGINAGAPVLVPGLSCSVLRRGDSDVCSGAAVHYNLDVAPGFRATRPVSLLFPEIL